MDDAPGAGSRWITVTSYDSRCDKSGYNCGPNMRAAFERYIGIDYSGAETCESSLKGLRVYMADCASEPREVAPPASPRWYWTREAIAHWLVERLSEAAATLVGIDHGFSFPLKYFEKYSLARDWPAFLDDFKILRVFSSCGFDSHPGHHC